MYAFGGNLLCRCHRCGDRLVGSGLLLLLAAADFSTDLGGDGRRDEAPPKSLVVLQPQRGRIVLTSLLLRCMRMFVGWA